MHATSLLASALVLVCASTAGAGPLADALRRHSAGDVETLRGQRDDVAARCTLGAIYAKRKDLTRAALYLEGCADAELPDDVAADIARVARELRQALRDRELAVVEVISDPPGLVAAIDALPGEAFATPATVYLPAGTYTAQITVDGKVVKATVTAQKHSRAPLILDTKPARFTPAGPKDHQVNIEDELASETQQSGPPPDVKHKNIMPTKYIKGMTATGEVAANPNAIEDPLATYRPAPRAPRAYWLGLRLGGGMFDDGATGARAGMALAGVARFPLASVPRTFWAARLDWTRRGGSLDDPSGDTRGIDTLGASAGAGRTVVDTSALGVALVAQLRGDLRLGDRRMTEPVSRAGVTAAIAVELALPRTPIAAGLRFEQGLTTIVPGARDRAVLVELGVDLR